MKAKKVTIEKSATRNVATVILGLSLLTGLGRVAQADERCVTNPLGPDICVSFEEGMPQPEWNFSVDYETDPANPSVELWTGSQTWNVRSDAGREAGNIGIITLNPTVPSDNFEVTIFDGENAGAANVGSINLTASGSSGYSSITGGTIDGNLTGDLTVKKDTVGNGGKLDLEITGDAQGNITAHTIPTGSTLKIGNYLSGSVTINEDVSGLVDVYMIWGGHLTVGGDLGGGGRIDIKRACDTGGQSDPWTFSVKGNVGENASIEFGDYMMCGYAEIDMNACTGTTAGDLLFGNGITSGWIVSIHGGFTGSLDLNQRAVAGELRLHAGGSGTVASAGGVGGTVDLAQSQDATFSGTATFASISTDGVVRAQKLTGSISVPGDAWGNIEVPVIGGTVTIVGELSGDIDVTDRIDGGGLFVGGAVTSTSWIYIADMVTVGDPPTLRFNTSGELGELDFAGDLVLGSGLGYQQLVYVKGSLTNEALVLLLGDTAGWLEFPGGGSGYIANTGELSSTGWVLLGQVPTTFSGTAGFASVASGALIKTRLTDLDGTIEVVGDMDGTIDVNGDMNGAILVDGNITGAIDIDGDVLCGQIHADADGEDGGTITGYVTVVGEFNGDICDASPLDPADACDEENWPVNIDIMFFGAAGTICDQGPSTGITCEDDADCISGECEWVVKLGCTKDTCNSAACEYDYVDNPYGDVYPVPWGDEACEGFDILCVLDAANNKNTYGCLTVLGLERDPQRPQGYKAGDIWPCDPPDGAVEGYDILAVLDASNEIYWCDHWCDDYPCSRGRGGGEGGGVGNARWAFVTFLTQHTPNDEDTYRGLVTLVANWLIEHMTCDQRADLVGELQDASLKFASDFAASLVPEIVELLLCE